MKMRLLIVLLFNNKPTVQLMKLNVFFWGEKNLLVDKNCFKSGVLKITSDLGPLYSVSLIFILIKVNIASTL